VAIWTGTPPPSDCRLDEHAFTLCAPSGLLVRKPFASEPPVATTKRFGLSRFRSSCRSSCRFANRLITHLSVSNWPDALPSSVPEGPWLIMSKSTTANSSPGVRQVLNRVGDGRPLPSVSSGNTTPRPIAGGRPLRSRPSFSRKIVAGRFDADTTWSHFCLLRPALERHGCPASFYTDGLSLFGHTSASDRLDTLTQFQRALGALKINHRVAPSPQAKGKIERLFGTFQKRLVTLLRYEKIRDFDQANQLLEREIDYYNQAHCHSTTGLTPNQAWEKALQEKRCRLRPAPIDTLLNLHLALHIPRRVSSASSIEFLGRTWKIAPTRHHSVLIIHHPKSRFWVIPPTKNFAKWPDVLGCYTL
jgi:hypothetical protein